MSLMHEPSPEKLPLPTTAARDVAQSLRAGLEFVSADKERTLTRTLASAGYLVARTGRADAARTSVTDVPSCGRLREALEGAIEMTLALRGAVPPNVAVGVPYREMAADQVYRVRALGAKGLCLVLTDLARIRGDAGVLEAADSEVLRVWKDLSEQESVVVLLDEEDVQVSLLAPVPLEVWGKHAANPAAPTSLPWAEDEPSTEAAFDRQSDFDFDPDELVLDAEVETLAHADSDTEEHEEAVAPEPSWAREAIAPAQPLESDRLTLRDATRKGTAKQASLHFADDSGAVMRHDPLAGLEDDFTEPQFPSDADLFDGLFAGTAITPASVVPDVPEAGLFSALTPSPATTDVTSPKRRNAAAPKKPRPATNRRAMARALETDLGDAEEAHEETTTLELPPRPKRRFDNAKLREHATILGAAKGSRPVKQIEQLYVEHYAPLLEAVSAGYDDRDAERAISGWRASFEKSYQESFASIRVTGKRPKMVLDAPEEAIRSGKLHGARSVQLVLVDAMRYGLGERVQRRLEASMSDLGTCVEKQVLWSALPSVTSVQMQLLAQGARGLREIQAPSERDLTAYRDGTARIPRRERIGQRDLLKLDVVEARLRDAGGGFEARMDDLAEEVADALVKVAESVPPRTMMYVFGDHGFFLRNTSDGRTAKAEQGGARPEEVLVPGYAWLIGGTH